jgi:hypothetical protein
MRMSWLAVVIMALVAACGGAPNYPSMCPAPNPSAQAAAAAQAPVYSGELTTTVDTSSAQTPKLSVQEPMTLTFEESRVGILLRMLQPGTPSAQDSGCILMVSGSAIGGGACQAASDSTGSSLVMIDGGTITRSPDGKQITLSVHGTLSMRNVDMSQVLAAPVAVSWTFQGTQQAPSPPLRVSGPPTLKMTFAKTNAFLDAPFPNQMRAKKDGTVDVDGLPDPSAPPMRWYDVKSHIVFGVLKDIVGILRTMGSEQGFGVASGVFFQSTAPLDALDTSIHKNLADAFVLVPVLPGTGGIWRLGAPQPVRAAFRAKGGSLQPDNVLTILPVQGVPLAENTLYVAFVRSGLPGPHGTSLAASLEMSQLTALGPGTQPPSEVPVEYAHAVEALRAGNVALGAIAAMTVFQTGHPSADLRAYYAHAQVPLKYSTHFKLVSGAPDAEFCTYEAKADVPVYQTGTPPYQVGLGVDWLTSLFGITPGGTLMPSVPPVPPTLSSRVVVTVPKGPTPARWPLGVFLRAGAGLTSYDAPLVDRGPTLASQTSTGCLQREDPKAPAANASNQTCGAGPAREFARAGLVGITVDGPQTGSRLRPGSSIVGAVAPECGIRLGDGEDNAMFDVCNPRAITDNVRESALEAAAIPKLLMTQPAVVDGKDPCHLASAKFDEHKIALMGHSMGATIAPLALFLQPAFTGVVLSGANGSYVENIVAKEMPYSLATELEGLLGLKYNLDEFDFLPSLFQWAEERSDPEVYEPGLFDGSRGAPAPDTLMVQGIGDHYIPPPVADVSSVALRLDLAGPENDLLLPENASAGLEKPNEKLVTCANDPKGGNLAWPPPITLLDPLLKAFEHRQLNPILPQGISDNRKGSTGAVSQYVRDHACRQDGHEVAYEIGRARWQYRCFLQSFAKGRTRVFGPPDVPDDHDTDEIDAPCPAEAR